MPRNRRFLRPFYIFVIASVVASSLWTTSRPVAAQEAEPPTPIPPEAQALEEQGATITYGANGLARFISFEQPGEAVSINGFAVGTQTEEEAARGFLSSYGGAFGLQDESQELGILHETHTDEGASFVRFQQFYQGVPVFGGELIVGLDGSRNVRSANGEITSDLAISTSPTIDSSAAVATALDITAQSNGVAAASLTASPAELWIYDPSLIGPADGPARLVWRTEVTPNEPAPIRELVLVDAADGSIALHFNQVDGLDTPGQSQAETPTEVPTETATEDSLPTETATSTEAASETANAPTEVTATETTAPTETPTLAAETTPVPDLIPLGDQPLETLAATWYVAPSPTGSDSNSCSAPGAPCATINGAIAKAASGDTIKVAMGTYTGTGTEVVLINKSVTISGGWNSGFTSQTGLSTVDGQATRRVINISVGVTATIDRMTVTNGHDDNNHGGGIYNSGNLTLTNSTVSNNISTNANGGGIFNWGTLTLTNSLVSSNSSGLYGGGIYSGDSRTLIINSSTITSNSAIVAGGVFNDNGSLTISNSTISSNGAEGLRTQGPATVTDTSVIGNISSGIRINGGIQTFTRVIVSGNKGGGITGGGEVTINNSLISQNSSTTSGGGINFYGQLTLNNVTISGNHAGANGGGIYNDGLNANLNLFDTTVTNNTAQSGGGIYYNGNSGGYINLRNSIIARNLITPSSSSSWLDIQCASSINTVTSSGYNLIGSISNCNFTSATGDQLGTVGSPLNPLLGPLQNNGGPTLSHAPRVGSPVINAGNPVAPGSGGNACLATDQRGVARPVDGRCDIGAFEGVSSAEVGSSPVMLTYWANHLTSLPGSLLCDQNQLSCTNGSNNDADKAHKYAFDTYNFYATNFGRDSLDNNGMTMISSVNYSVNYANAGWTGTQMIYGDGFAAADDVVGHELTHGVTQYEANLIYYYQPGAINEALSDIFGEFVDLTNGAGNDAPGVRWLMGEDLPGGAIRNMQNPPQFGNPDKMTSANYYTGSSDNGGVHTNSGIANKAAYLIADGGTFNGYTVTGLGVIKAAHIFYEAQTTLLTSGSDYGDLYNALYQACTNLAGGSTGITVFDCVEVRDATNATEMNLQPVAGFNTEAPLCSSGQVPTNIFFDDFESGTGNWTFTALSGSNRWSLDSQFAHSGVKDLYASDSITGAANSPAAMASSVTLQSNSFLHFSHVISLASTDGGFLEYSTNGGSSWTDAAGLPKDNGYASGGKFTGVSHGYVSSRYNLASLGTSAVRFRWRFNTDATASGGAWFLDDVRIYTCAVPSAATCYTLNTSIVSNGTVALPPTNCSDGSARYSPGSAFTLTAVPAHGYYFQGWTGSYVSSDPALPVTMSSNVSLTAGFAAFPCPYTDISGSFARDAICEIAARDVMAPATATTFNTQGLITRATMATFLAGAYAAATGSEATVVSVPFTDIGSLPTDVQDDIARIYGLGITTGTTATTYAPTLNISRNQMGVFLARLYKSIYGSNAPTVFVPFTDIWTVGEEWAQPGIAQIYGLGITIGTTATTYTPYALVTREQMALFIVRLLRATGN